MSGSARPGCLFLRNRGWRRTGHLSARNHARSSSAIMSLIVPNPRRGRVTAGQERVRGVLKTARQSWSADGSAGIWPWHGDRGRAAFSCGGHDRTAETTSETGAPPGLLPLITERVRHVHTVDTPSRCYERTYGRPAWSLAAHPNDLPCAKIPRRARHGTATLRLWRACTSAVSDDHRAVEPPPGPFAGRADRMSRRRRPNPGQPEHRRSRRRAPGGSLPGSPRACKGSRHTSCTHH